jgi:hypothetical protein
MKITFSEAKSALQHVQKQRTPNGKQWIPDLLQAKGVGGWCYHLKKDLRDAFEVEIERMQDLSQETGELLPEGVTSAQKDDIDGFDIDDEAKERLHEIIDTLDEIRNTEKDITLTKGKIPETKINKHINGLVFEDLAFAIKLDTDESNG